MNDVFAKFASHNNPIEPVSIASLRIAVIGMRGLYTNYSGIERVGRELYPALAQRGHRVTVFSRENETVPTEVREGIRTERVLGTGWGSMGTPVQCVSSLLAVLKRDFDVVHLHALTPGLIAPCLRAAGLPTVLTIQGLDWKRARWKGLPSKVIKAAERMAVHYVDEIIVVSEELQQYYCEHYSRITHLIYNAVTLNNFKNTDINNCDRPSNSGYFLLFSRLVPEKRVEDVISAFLKSGIQQELAIAGEGPKRYTEFLCNLAKESGNVKFLGHRSEAELRELISGATACVSASELEGFSLALLECVSQGVPLVLSDIAPHRELFSRVPDYPLFFELANIEQLSERLRLVNAERATFKQKAAQLAPSLSEQFSVKEMVMRTESLLLKAASKNLM